MKPHLLRELCERCTYVVKALRAFTVADETLQDELSELADMLDEVLHQINNTKAKKGKNV